jgi:hypothetical protein
MKVNLLFRLLNEMKLTELQRSNLALALDPDTDSKTLDKLADGKDVTIKYWVAKNPNTSIKTLDKLSRGQDRQVRLGVVINPNTSTEILNNMLNTGSFLDFIARHPNATEEQIIKCRAKKLIYNLESKWTINH